MHVRYMHACTRFVVQYISTSIIKHGRFGKILFIIQYHHHFVLSVERLMGD